MENSKLVQSGLMDAHNVAEQGYAALMRGQTAVVPGLRNRLMALVVRFTPRAMAARVAMNMQAQVGH
jgi:short-subunit dehydrogenase